MNETAAPGSSGPVTELVFDLEDDAYPLVRLSATLDGDGLTVLDRIPSTAERPTTQVFCTVEETPEEALSVLRECDRTAQVSVVDERPGESLLCVRIRDSVARSVADAGALLLSSHFEAGRGEFRVLVPPDRAPQTTVEELRTAHPTLSLLSVTSRAVALPLATRRTFRGLLRDRLTDRQWEVLHLAYERGYFERPRGTTQSDLATAVGISQETVSQHLGAAQRHLLAVVFDEARSPSPNDESGQ